MYFYKYFRNGVFHCINVSKISLFRIHHKSDGLLIHVLSLRNALYLCMQIIASNFITKVAP